MSEVIIPEGTKKIEKRAFKKNEEITSVVIPGSVKEIGQMAFQMCTNLERVTIEKGIKVIDEKAFKQCDKLEEIEIPITVERINHEAFRDCTNLKKIVIRKGISNHSVKAFHRCSSLKEVTIPRNTRIIGMEAFSECAELEVVNILPGLKEIWGRAFIDCKKLKKVVLPNTLEEIGYESFKNCESLEEVIIPASVTEIEWGAFENCTRLSRVIFEDASKLNPKLKHCFKNTPFEAALTENGDEIAYIGKCLYAVGPNVKEITVKPGTEYIDTYLGRVEKLVVPEGAENLDIYEFNDMWSLKELTIPSTVTSFESRDLRCFAVNKVMLRIPAGGIAEIEAIKNNIPFEYIDNFEPSKQTSKSIETMQFTSANGNTYTCIDFIPNDRYKKIGVDIKSDIINHTEYSYQLNQSFLMALFRGDKATIEAAIDFLNQLMASAPVFDVFIKHNWKLSKTNNADIFEILVYGYDGRHPVDEVMARFPLLKMTALYESQRGYQVNAVLSLPGYGYVTHVGPDIQIDGKSSDPFNNMLPTESYEKKFRYMQTGGYGKTEYEFPYDKEWNACNYVVERDGKLYEIIDASIKEQKVKTKTAKRETPQKKVTETPEHYDTDFVRGERVSHPKFGEGIIKSSKGGVVTVDFSGKSMQMALGFAPLKKIE